MSGLNSSFDGGGLHQLLERNSDPLMPAWAYTAAAVVLFIIGFLGFSLNLIVIVIMLKDKQLWTPLNIILFNLVLSDFLVAVLGNPWTFASAVAKGWVFGNTGCIIYGFIMALCGITSITTLTVLAFERYMMIAQPFRCRHLSHQTGGCLVIAIWIYSSMLTVPPLIGWGEYVNEGANISCSVNWEEKTLNSTTYIVYLFALGLFIPLIIISFSYVNIIVAIKKNTFRMGRVNKAEGKIAYMVIIMILAFVIAWSPYAILALIVQFGDSSIEISPGVAILPAILAKSSICYNPIIYVGFNTQFRQSFQSLRHVKGEKEQVYSNCETIGLTQSKFFAHNHNIQRDIHRINNEAQCEEGIFVTQGNNDRTSLK